MEQYAMRYDAMNRSIYCKNLRYLEEFEGRRRSQPLDRSGSGRLGRAFLAGKRGRGGRRWRGGGAGARWGSDAGGGARARATAGGGDVRQRGAPREVAGAANGGSSGGGVRRRSGAAAGDGRGRARAAARRATGPRGPSPGLAGFGGGAVKWARDCHVARPGWLRAAARFVRRREGRGD